MNDTKYVSHLCLRRDQSVVRPLEHLLLPDDIGQYIQAVHRLLWTTMPEAVSREAERLRAMGTPRSTFLWRPISKSTFVMLGPKPIDDNPYLEVETQAYTPPEEGPFKFDLRVHATQHNPAHRRVSIGRNRPPRKRREAIEAWLRQWSTHWGFVIRQLRRIQYTACAIPGHPPDTFDFFDLAGQIEVVDAVRFTEAQCRGIGRGKAFGCGLISSYPQQA